MGASGMEQNALDPCSLEPMPLEPPTLDHSAYAYPYPDSTLPSSALERMPLDPTGQEHMPLEALTPMPLETSGLDCMPLDAQTTDRMPLNPSTLEGPKLTHLSMNPNMESQVNQISMEPPILERMPLNPYPLEYEATSLEASGMHIRPSGILENGMYKLDSTMDPQGTHHMPPTHPTFLPTFVKVEEGEELGRLGGRCGEMEGRLEVDGGCGDLEGRCGVVEGGNGGNMWTMKMDAWQDESEYPGYVNDGTYWVLDQTYALSTSTNAHLSTSSPSDVAKDPTAQGKRLDVKVCGVCGDRALGYNFNAITCESCKAFFRRNALKKKDFRCPFQDNCKVDQITRRFCQKCRLRKCFEIGMKKEWIMTEDEKKRKKQKIEENRARKNIEDDSSSSSSSSSSAKSRQFGPFCPFPPNASVITETAKPHAVVVGIMRSDEELAKVARMDGQTDVHQARQQQQQQSSTPSPRDFQAREMRNQLNIGDEGGGSGFSSPSPHRPEGERVWGVGARRSLTPTPTTHPHHHQHQEGGGISRGRFIKPPPEDSTSLGQDNGAQGTGSRPISQGRGDEAYWRLETSQTLDKSSQASYGLLEVSQGFDEAATEQYTISLSAKKSQKASQNQHETLRENHQAPAPWGTASRSLETPRDSYEEAAKEMTATLQHTDSPQGQDQTSREHPRSSKEVPEPSKELGGTEKGHSVVLEDTYGSFNVQEALGVLCPGYKSDPSVLSMWTLLDTAITAEFSPSSHLAEERKDEATQLTQAELDKLAELSEANRGLTAPLNDDYNFKDINNPSLINIINLTEIATRRLITTAKQIKAFRSLCQGDQIALLKGGCAELMLLRSVCAYDPDKDSWKIQEGQESFKNIQLKVLKSAPGNVYEEHKKFVDSFPSQWRSDHHIIYLLSAITLFTPHRPNLAHPSAVLHEQCSYLFLLRRYLEAGYGWCEGRTAYLSLLHRLAHLHRLSENHIRLFLQVNPCQVEPLLTEIFDLKQR